MKKNAIIQVKGNSAYLNGVPRQLVDEALLVVHHEAVMVNGHPCVQRSGQSICLHEENGDVVFPAGLVRRVAMALRSQGYEVRVDEQLPWLPLLEARRRAEEHGIQVTKLQDAFLRHPHGQVTVVSLRQAADVIAEASDLYPTSNILVVVMHNADESKVGGYLTELVPERLHVLGRDAGQKRGDVVSPMLLREPAAAQPSTRWRFTLASRRR